jgi:hypothetical protein
VIFNKFLLNQESFGKIGKTHRGSQNLFPELVSQFCYRPSFKWKQLADQMSAKYIKFLLYILYEILYNILGQSFT